MNYEDRLILFVDFLGFKNEIEKTEEDPIALERLVKATEELGTVKEFIQFESGQITQFSDCLVISFLVNEESGVFYMLNAISMMVLILVGKGYLIRGAVTYGKLYHTPEVLVGPAMVKAYEMESKSAIYPRIIVDEGVLEIARSNKREGHRDDEELEYVNSFIISDKHSEYDDLKFIDYISWNSVVAVIGADDDCYADYITIISNLVKSGLSHENHEVRKKYVWLHGHYIDAIDVFKGMPPEHPYREQSPNNCAVIEVLPTFDSLL